jgi:hypothetical protein
VTRETIERGQTPTLVTEAVSAEDDDVLGEKSA